MGYRSTHADAGIHGRQRRQKTKGITADIAGNKDLHPGEIKENPTMRTTGTHIRRSIGQFDRLKQIRAGTGLNRLAHYGGIQLALIGDQSLP